MGKRLKEIKIIQNGITKILSGAREIFKLTSTITDKKLKGILLAYVIAVSETTFNLSMYLMTIVPSSYKKDIIDKKFEKLIKPLEKEFKRKRRKK